MLGLKTANWLSLRASRSHPERVERRQTLNSPEEDSKQRKERVGRKQREKILTESRNEKRHQ